MRYETGNNPVLRKQEKPFLANYSDIFMVRVLIFMFCHT